MSEIRFQSKFSKYSTDAPALIHPNEIFGTSSLVFYGLGDDYGFSTVLSDSVPGLISSVKLTEKVAEPRTIPNQYLNSSPIGGTANDVGKLTYSQLATLMPEVQDKCNVFTIELGHNENTGDYCELALEFTRISIYSNYSGYGFRYYLITGNRGTQTKLEHTIVNSNLTLWSDAGLQHEVVFGLPLIDIPDRTDYEKESYERAIMPLVMTRGSADWFDDVRSYQWQYAVDGPTTYQFDTDWYISATNHYFRMYGAIDIMKLLRDLDLVPSTEYTSEEAGDPSEPGGYHEDDGGSTGAFDDSSDTISVPSLPTLGATNVGFINAYKVTSNTIQTLATELFPALVFTPPVPVTGGDVIETLVNALNQMIVVMAQIPQYFEQINASKYIEYVLDCHIIPVSPAVESSLSPVKVGNKTLVASGYKATSDYVEVSCGTLSLAEYYANFADFLTSFKLYLPFVGFVSARPEWFYRESIEVIYHFNIVDGSFMAYVLSTGKYVNNNNPGKTVLGQYSGNCCVHIPITGISYASMFGGMTGATGGLLGGIMNMNPMAAASSLLSTANMNGDVVESNSYNASPSFLAIRRPFVVIERPVASFSEKYAIEKGIPSNVARKLDSVTGFSMIGDVHLDGIDATEAEKLEIERLLHEGVIL